MRESKASPVVVCSPCRRKKALSTRCQLICWPLLPTFLGGLVTQPNKGRTSPWQMPAGQAGAANVSWSASAGRRCCCCVQGFQNSTSLLPSCGKSITFFSCPKPIPPFSSLHRCILHHIFLTSCQSTFNHPHHYLNLKRRHNNTFSHHPAPAQCTPPHLCNLLSSHVKHTILYSFV